VDYEIQCCTGQINNKRVSSQYDGEKGRKTITRDGQRDTHSWKEWTDLMALDGTFITDIEIFTFCQLYRIDIDCIGDDGRVTDYKWYGDRSGIVPKLQIVWHSAGQHFDSTIPADGETSVITNAVDNQDEVETPLLQTQKKKPSDDDDANLTTPAAKSKVAKHLLLTPSSDQSTSISQLRLPRRTGEDAADAFDAVTHGVTATEAPSKQQGLKTASVANSDAEDGSSEIENEDDNDTFPARHTRSTSTPPWVAEQANGADRSSSTVTYGKQAQITVMK
jgi:hypothetical protein